jgi:hypothetical protein
MLVGTGSPLNTRCANLCKPTHLDREHSDRQANRWLESARGSTEPDEVTRDESDLANGIRDVEALDRPIRWYGWQRWSRRLLVPRAESIPERHAAYKYHATPPSRIVSDQPSRAVQRWVEREG